MKDPASIESQEEVTNEIEALILGASTAALIVIAESVRNAGKHKNISRVYTDLPKTMDKVENKLKRCRIEMNKKIDVIFDEMADGNQVWAEKYFASRNIIQRRWSENRRYSMMIEKGKQAAKGISEGMINTLVDGIVGSNGTFYNLRDYYIKKTTEAVNAALVGDETYDQIITKTAREMARSGIRVRYMPREGGKPVTRELYSAISTNVMGTYKEIMSDMRIAQGEEFGADGVEVTAHFMCAPDHQPFQGRQYAKWSFDFIQRDLKRPLVTGANCGHDVNPIILGISEPAYSREELEHMKNYSNKQITFTGLGGGKLTMTRYKASQYMRRIERELRTVKNEKVIGEAAGDDVSSQNATIDRLQKIYKNISEDTGVPMRRDRTKAYIAK